MVAGSSTAGGTSAIEAFEMQQNAGEGRFKLLMSRLFRFRFIHGDLSLHSAIKVSWKVPTETGPPYVALDALINDGINW